MRKTAGIPILFWLASFTAPAADLVNVCSAAPQSHSEEISSGQRTWRKAGASYQGDYNRWLLDLNALFPPTDDARHYYLLRLDLESDAEDAAMCLKALHLQSTLQMAELSLPGGWFGDGCGT